MASDAVEDLLPGVDQDSVMVHLRNPDSTSKTMSLGWTYL